MSKGHTNEENGDVRCDPSRKGIEPTIIGIMIILLLIAVIKETESVCQSRSEPVSTVMSLSHALACTSQSVSQSVSTTRRKALVSETERNSEETDSITLLLIACQSSR